MQFSRPNVLHTLPTLHCRLSAGLCTSQRLEAGQATRRHPDGMVFAVHHTGLIVRAECIRSAQSTRMPKPILKQITGNIQSQSYISSYFLLS